MWQRGCGSLPCRHLLCLLWPWSPRILATAHLVLSHYHWNLRGIPLNGHYSSKGHYRGRTQGRYSGCCTVLTMATIFGSSASVLSLSYLYQLDRMETSEIVCHTTKRIHENNTQRSVIETKNKNRDKHSCRLVYHRQTQTVQLNLITSLSVNYLS